MSPVRLTVLLVILFCALSALAALELYYGIDAGVDTGPPASATPPPALASLPAFELPDLEDLAETTTRPLFVPGRRMPEDTAQEPAPETPEPVRAPEIRRLSLSAVVIVEDQRVALLNDVATGSISRVREGDSVSGWRVLEIRDDSVVVENGSNREELPLRSFEPPPPPQAARNPPAVTARRSAARDGAENPDVKRPRRPRRFTPQPER